MCGICGNETPFFWRDNRRRWEHFTSIHPGIQWSSELQEKVEVQSFGKDDSNRRDFRVVSALLSASQEQHTAAANPNSADLAKALITNWKTSKPKEPNADATLKDMEPFPLYSGWGNFLAGKAWEWHLELLVDPQPGTPLKRIVDTALPLFKKIMDKLPKIPVAIRKHAMDENKK
jgi:hypothetical protein